MIGEFINIIWKYSSDLFDYMSILNVWFIQFLNNIKNKYANVPNSKKKHPRLQIG